MGLGTLPETQAAADEFARQQGMPASELTLVQKFKSKVANFMEALDRLQSSKVNASKYPDLATQRENLLSRGASIKNTIKTVTGMVDRVFSFFKGSGLDGLGIAPLLPIAAITIAVAAITKWTTEAYEFSKRLDAIKDLESKGYDPVRAGQIVNQQFPSPTFSFGGMSSILPLLAVAGVIFYVIKTGKLK